MAAHVHRMPFGAAVRDGGGGVDFRLWAPAAQRVELVLGDGRVVGAPRGADGWHEVGVDEAADGTRYRWRIDGETLVPDPASRCNPEGPYGPSEVVDPAAFDWDEGWRGRPWHEVVLYELHVGCFTQQGTYEAAEAELGALVALGVTAIELMPLASFPGRYGWGYDGVLPYAPHAAYGTPAQLRHFVQAAHRHGLMVFVDVVYNHFGPDGNWLHRYAPQFFTERHATPWGAAINYDGDGAATVREFFIHNALYWIDEFRVDGLRLDAVHQIVDDGVPHVLDELSRRVRAASAGRNVHLVLENERNDAAHLGPPATPDRYDAQWNDDFHHAMHVLLSGERDGYYAAFAEQPVEQLARVLVAGFARERPATDARFRPATGDVPLTRCVFALQNHDQVGNRAFGERLLALAPPEALHVAAALLLLAPAVPLLFMGEEFGSARPFQHFADWQGELADAVREGRRREFAHFPRFAEAAARGELPDPCSAATFERCKLEPPAAHTREQHAWRVEHAALLALRKRWLVPLLPRLRDGAHSALRLGERGLAVRWRFDDGQALEAVVQLGPGEQALPPPQALPPLIGSRVLHSVGTVRIDALGAWSGLWQLGREPA
jgi:1,4-alpha-glucan branching enzyme/maltooligosyltrehalose trehalohydrolase